MLQRFETDTVCKLKCLKCQQEHALKILRLIHLLYIYLVSRHLVHKKVSNTRRFTPEGPYTKNPVPCTPKSIFLAKPLNRTRKPKTPPKTFYTKRLERNGRHTGNLLHQRVFPPKLLFHQMFLSTRMFTAWTFETHFSHQTIMNTRDILHQRCFTSKGWYTRTLLLQKLFRYTKQHLHRSAHTKPGF